GEIRLPLAAADEEKILEAALEAGADDVTQDGEEHIILTAPDQLFAVGDALRGQALAPASQKLVQVPLTNIAVGDASTASQILRLCHFLDDLDDVQNVYANFDIPEELLDQVSQN